MKNPMQILARMFRRSENPVVTQLYTHAIGRPLLVHPAIGEQVIGAYMAGGMDAPGPVVSESPAANVAVINVSGGLVSRPMPDMCGAGPMSYEEIRGAFDSAMADDSIAAIVLRMDTPGGMVSGCFDLTDHIAESRGSKPIIASVDDMAYSAGYAIASACDEIWLTRSGGVGSIGVVAYHIDQTAYNDREGFKVTPIYAGGHKVDFSPHVTLTDEAKAREQAEVDSLYSMFVESVAKYRGIDAAAVVATDALTYTGAAAVAAGLADKVGTFRDVIASLAADIAQAQADALAAAVKTAEAEQAEIAAQADKLEKATVVDALMAANIAPDLREALLGAGLKLADVEARVIHAQAVADICRAAGVRASAKDYIAKGVELSAIRTQLINSKVDTDAPEISTTIPGAKSGTAGSGIWGETIKKFGG